MENNKKFTLPKIYRPSYKSKDKRWFIKYKVLTEKGLELQRVMISHSKYPTPKQKEIQSKKVIEEITKSLVSGEHPLFNSKRNKSNWLLEDAINKIWLNWTRSIEKRTITDYDILLRYFFLWLNENGYKSIKVIDFDYEIALEYSDYIKEKINNRTGELLSNKRVNNILTFQSTLFKKLVSNNFLKVNFFEKIERLKVRNRQIYYIEKDVREKIFINLKQKNIELYRFCVCIYYFLARPIELLNIQLKDIDLKNQSITIYEDCVKNDKRKIIRIPDVTMPIFINMDIGVYPSDFYLFGRGLKTGVKKIKHSKDVSFIFRNEVRRFGIDNTVLMYRLKHTGAQDYIAQGAPLIEVMRQAGISDKVMIINYLELAKAKSPGVSLIKNAMPLVTESNLTSLNDVEKILSDFNKLSKHKKEIFFSKMEALTPNHSAGRLAS